MNWAAILSSVLKLFVAIADTLRAKRLMSAGETKARADAAEGTNDAIVDKAKIDADVSGLSDKQLADELRKWSKNGSDN